MSPGRISSKFVRVLGVGFRYHRHGAMITNLRVPLGEEQFCAPARRQSRAQPCRSLHSCGIKLIAAIAPAIHTATYFGLHFVTGIELLVQPS